MRVTETEAGVRWRAEARGRSAGAFLGRLHRTHAWLEVDDDVPAGLLHDLVDALSRKIGLPLAAKATPGTPRHAQLMDAGARVYQTVPPSLISCTDEDNLEWARGGPAAGVRDLTEVPEEDRLDWWTDTYDWVHASWSPLASREAAVETFGQMLRDDLHPEHSRAVMEDGCPVAVGFVFAEPDGWLVCCEAVDPDHPHASEAVDACLRAVVSGLAQAGATAVLVDGHVSDPHLYPALRQVPTVGGPGLHLLQLGASS